MLRNYLFFLLLILTMPVFLGITIWQSNQCGSLRNSISRLESDQIRCVNENKKLTNEIADLLASDRLEAKAREMGMEKMRPENVILIEMGGKGHGL